MKRTWVFGSIGLIALVGGGAFFFSSTSWKDDEQLEERPQVVVVKRGVLRTQVSETGTLEPTRTIDIKSQFSGEVRQILVKEGQQVSKDQALAVIRQEPSQARQVAQLRASLEQEGINVEQARRDLLRKQSLFAKGFISRSNLENAQQDARRAMVRRQLAERELLLALGGNQELFLRYVSQDPSTTRLEEFRVYSPSGGTVIDVNVQPGEIITSGTATVGGGTVLMKLADITKMVAKAKINEVNIARVQVGQPVTVHLDAIPGSLFEGTVTVIAPQGEKDESIVTYEVTIEIENVGLSLRPMMTANIDILTDDLDNVITIPLETLQSEEGDDVVYVEEDGKRVRRKVRVVLRTDSEAVVVQGLEEGDRVILPSYTESPSRR